MPKFAKLFELEGDEQVLVTNRYNQADDVFEVQIRTDSEDIVAQIALTFEEEDKAIRYFESFSLTHAVNFRKEFIS